MGNQFVIYDTANDRSMIVLIHCQIENMTMFCGLDNNEIFSKIFFRFLFNSKLLLKNICGKLILKISETSVKFIFFIEEQSVVLNS